MNKRDLRLTKIADIGSTLQQAKDYILGDNKSTTQPQQATQSQQTTHSQLDLQNAIAYNTKSEETFKRHEDDIKRILNTTADWKSPEFAQAVYDWQQKNGLTGKWIDGKYGPVTMAAVANKDPALKQQYGEEQTAPFLPDGKVKLRLTGYWPFTARPEERQMEGGIFDRAMPKEYEDKPDSPQYQAHILHTAEQHLSDPQKHPFVSLSGDDGIWPYGQEILIPWTNGETIHGRVVDTGSHFRGVGKVYRNPGYEPIDVCVNSSETKVPPLVEAQIVGGTPEKIKQMMPGPKLAPEAEYRINTRIKTAVRKAKIMALVK